MRKFILLTISTLTFAVTTTLAEAKRHAPVDPNGNTVVCAVKSGKTGATARVGCAHVSKFQAYIDDLENSHGAVVYFMGGTRRGKCWSGGLHPCGKALDLCQLSRGVVAAKCHLPGRVEIAAIAARHGLFEGGQWCHHDYGHAQVGVTAGACSETLTARSKKRHHRKTAVAVASPATFVPVDRLTPQ